MSSFELVERGNGVFVLKGELTFATVSDALKATSRLFGQGSALCFDLAEIGRADSAGVALLIEWIRCAERAGGGMRYAHLPESLQAIARVSGVEKLLPVEPSRANS